MHLQTRIAAEPLQLQPGVLQLQAIFCNCSRALLGCNCGLQTHQIFRCICNGAAALQFLVSANLQVLQLQGRKLGAKGLFPPPPAANSQFGRASCTAHSYRALAAERGEAFARFGWWISISLCSAESLHGTSPVRPTQEGLITKSLHGTRETLLMLVRMRRSRTTEPIGPLGFSGPHTALRAQLMVSVQLGACSAAKKHPSKPAPRALAQKFRLVRMLYVGRHRTARTRVTPSALRRLEAGWD